MSTALASFLDISIKHMISSISLELNQIVVGRYSPRLLQETNSESANEQNRIEINKTYEQY